MSRPRITPKDAIIAAYQRLGPVCGIIMAIGWIIEWIFIILLEWFKPSNKIDRVPHFTTTPLQFDMWNQLEISPYGEVNTESTIDSTLKSNTANLEEVARCLVTEETVTAATATPVVVPAISLNASRSRDNVGGHSRDIGSRSRKKQRRDEEE
ncbi:hypothetical protein ECG_09952 [Echinococcus granulosus]|nr:hypothetical protein ECG_09952 [Echinococcus granulosus]